LKVEGAEVLRDSALFVLQECTKVKISRWMAGLAFALAGLAAGQAADDKPYQIADGNKVDKATLAHLASARLRALPWRQAGRAGRALPA
jgi:hypothetical protein